MKTIKKALLGTAILGSVAFFGLGSFNSIVVDKNAFLKNDLNIKFAKRLDDMKGEITIGRMAASLPKWTPTESIQPVKEVIKINKRALQIAKKLKLAKKSIIAPKATSGPAVKKDLPSLELTGGFYNKKPLVNGKGYSGTAKVMDGIIEEIDVTLPDGKKFILNTNERMVGNVFQYEDTETREMRSGLIYPVNIKEGKYMITLTDDTNYKGMRLEFKAQKGAEFESNDGNKNWAMNEKPQDNQNLDINNFEDDSYEADQVDRYKDDYAQKQADDDAQRYEDEQFEEENNQDESLDEDHNNEMVSTELTPEQVEGTFSFNFNS